ncbi:unnamed protein product [Euphydryas editha]|uniref:Uncharacterized protein n=1 Tax=Euphydryas editha TaxID=104508 RepID=A0AAU9V4L7_EUPED|nr:unnamed protein product [Euphydryas editha]
MRSRHYSGAFQLAAELFAVAYNRFPCVPTVYALCPIARPPSVSTPLPLATIEKCFFAGATSVANIKHKEAAEQIILIGDNRSLTTHLKDKPVPARRFSLDERLSSLLRVSRLQQ